MSNLKYDLIPTHIDLIRCGDTIMHNGEMKTVCSSNIKKGGFMGTTIFGDSYHAGYKAVQLVVFQKPVLPVG